MGVARLQINPMRKTLTLLRILLNWINPNSFGKLSPAFPKAKLPATGKSLSLLAFQAMLATWAPPLAAYLPVPNYLGTAWLTLQ